ncbi:MAG: type II toxin-antitoxin system RelE/ParE family toxin [Prevotellaceae bacterium]|jgi:plasmid stabilization system protein ParE|nr:type II toxin-antitoxin system RelE/ParE family toxin [Prevotellaceae bacterium]
MVKKSLISRAKPQLKLSFSSTYLSSLKKVLEFGVDVFGKRVTSEFHNEIKQKIIRLRTMPNMYAKCRFIDSTETKTYRNIVVHSYLIIYSVTSTQITVIDIIHQSVSPENMKDRIK